MTKSGETGKTMETRNTGIFEPMYLSAFILLCVKITSDCSELFKLNDLADKMLVGVIVTLLCVKIVSQRYTPVRLLITVAVCVIISASCLIGGYSTFLLGFLFVVAMQDVSFEKIIKINYRFKTVFILFHVVIYIVVYMINPAAINFVYRSLETPRHYFYIGHANMFTAFLVWTCIEYIYLHYDKIKPAHFVIMWIINIIFYIYTDSNTGIVILAFLTLIVAYEKSGAKSVDRALTVLAKYIYTFIALLCTFLAIYYTRLGPAMKNVWLAVDDALTGRIKYGAYVYDVFGVTLMGRKLNIPEKIFWDGRWFDKFYYFDNYYHGNLLQFGIIHILVPAVAFAFIGSKLENREKIIIIVFSFYGIMEKYVINVFICFAFLIIGKYLYQKNKKPADATRPDDIYASG